jgi:hypothetical protein
MGTYSRLLAVNKNVRLNWDRLSEVKQQQIAKFLTTKYGLRSADLPATFNELMLVLDECKYINDVVPPLSDCLTACLPAFPERACAMFDAEGLTFVLIFDPAATRCQAMKCSRKWGKFHYDTYCRLEEGATPEELLENVNSGYEEDDEYERRAIQRTAAFRNSILHPFLSLDDPVEFLRQEEYYLEPPLRPDAEAYYRNSDLCGERWDFSG